MRGAAMVHLELTSAETARTFSAFNEAHIPVFHLAQSGDLSATFWVRRGDYPKISRLCAKRGDKLRILKKRGIYWAGIRLLHRPILIFALLLLLILGAFLPSRVLFVRVDGNENVPSRQILAAAEDCGVGFGASRRYVRSEKVKNALLQSIPELQWAGVNTSGCVATVSVRERNSREEGEVSTAQHIVADRDGFILSADVTRGTALIHTGQTVRKGETLVSGYSDCGICIRATGADGEIFAQTRRDFRGISPAQWAVRGSSRG